MRRLEALMDSAPKGALRWINVLSLNPAAWSALSRLPPLAALKNGMITQKLQQSELRQHADHLEIHDDYIYFQLLVHSSETVSISKGAHDPLLGMLRRTAREAVLFKYTGRKEMGDRTKGGLTRVLMRLRKELRVGLLSVFLVPASNTILTIIPQTREDPAARLVLFSATTSLFRPPGSGNTNKNRTSLSLSAALLIHQAVAYDAQTLKQLETGMRWWTDSSERYRSVKGAAELNDYIETLSLLKCRMRRRGSFLRQVSDSSSSGSAPKINAGATGAHPLSWDLSAAALALVEGPIRANANLLDQAPETLDRARDSRDFAFALTSARDGESMQTLAIVTIVFLPLTFLASYFSMGFHTFADLDKSVGYFWKVSAPLGVAFFVLFGYASVIKAAREGWAWFSILLEGCGRRLARYAFRVRMWLVWGRWGDRLDEWRTRPERSKAKAKEKEKEDKTKSAAEDGIV